MFLQLYYTLQNYSPNFLKFKFYTTIHLSLYFPSSSPFISVKLNFFATLMRVNAFVLFQNVDRFLQHNPVLFLLIFHNCIKAKYPPPKKNYLWIKTIVTALHYLIYLNNFQIHTK